MQTRGRILLADDEADLRGLMARALERHGYEVVPVADGRQAADAWCGEPQGFDVAILDVRMPVMGGYEAFCLCRDRSPQAKVLLISGYVDRALSERIAGEQNVRLVLKPFRTGELVAAIEGLLCAGQSEEESRDHAH